MDRKRHYSRALPWNYLGIKLGNVLTLNLHPAQRDSTVEVILKTSLN